ncbi:unnamed protein product [Miscanthus lutarioriparius]|uniref:protein-serine/threonine phosphatase n=1 Tax=Miscanthus lutarioriparius TaxID=422564 RepID=A0A811PZS5_9POAL|nr:unnamed protein product [Miscanthus lutarioriparius]
MATLKRERKLILVLDLDHTLLNSTRLQDLSAQEQRNGFTPYTGDELHMELFRLEYSDNVRMLVKLRRRSCEASWSRRLVRRQGRVQKGVDPAGHEESRRHPGRRPRLGGDPRRHGRCLAGHQDNLILMDRYHYFASTCRKFGYDIPSLAEQCRDEREQDCSLAMVLGVLEHIHKAFFDGDRVDVRDVIREVWRQVLPECTVVFSYLEEYMEDFPEDTLMWTLAERLGAACQKDVDGTVTHVVVEDPGTQKAQWAREHGKFLVNPEWINAVSFCWCRVDERGFPVTAHES